jgi:hypothetical protein
MGGDLKDTDTVSHHTKRQVDTAESTYMLTTALLLLGRPMQLMRLYLQYGERFLTVVGDADGLRQLADQSLLGVFNCSSSV